MSIPRRILLALAEKEEDEMEKRLTFGPLTCFWEKYSIHSNGSFVCSDAKKGPRMGVIRIL